MTPEQISAVVLAFRDGAVIQFRRDSDSDWQDCKPPHWNFAEFEYRVKQEPRTAYAVKLLDGRLGSRLFETHEKAKQYGNLVLRQLEVVELVEKL